MPLQHIHRCTESATVALPTTHSLTLLLVNILTPYIIQLIIVLYSNFQEVYVSSHEVVYFVAEPV